MTDKEMMEALYNQGYLQSDIGVLFRVGTDTVSEHLSDVKKRSRRGMKIEGLVNDEYTIVRAFANGKSISDLSAEFGASESTIYRILKKNGVKND